MRTTIDLPDDLLRRVKATAALKGLKMKDFVASLIAKGMAETDGEPATLGHRRPPPVQVHIPGIKAMTNAEIEDLLYQEDLERLK